MVMLMRETTPTDDATTGRPSRGLSGGLMSDGLMHGGLARAAERFGDREFVRAGDDAWSFRTLDDASTSFAHHLRSLGVGPGTRVALMSTNRVELVVAVHGISKAGAAAVLLSPAWKAAEVDHALAITAPVHAVADGPAVALLGERLPVLDLDDLDVVASAERARVESPEDVAIGPEDECVLVFSSGTTGMPKAVRHTHRSMGHATTHWVDALDLGEDDRFQVATPPSHILGLLNLLAAAEAGATVRLHPRFDIDAVLAAIERERMTLEMAVAPIALAMANHPDIERYDLSSLRYIMWGATPVTEAVAETVTRRTGVRWLPAYGASEVPVIACNPIHRPDAWRLDSAGLPAAGVELRVVDLDTGVPLAAGEIGEIQVRSPSAMAGYLPAEASSDAFAADAGSGGDWYRTGDVGWLEPDPDGAPGATAGVGTGGWVHLTDRSKEMIKVKGFQVAPAELEAVLLGHPAVRDCAVFGVADEVAGEVPVAAVQLDPDVPVADGELQQLVADSLATYKQLRTVVVVDDIPRLPSGKALRRVLRDEWSPKLAISGAGGAA
jgi:acyl-CoA synthetase (AMP-forming)/AMP-acid ligase II